MERDDLSCGELIKRLDEVMSKKANSDLLSYGITFSQMKMLIILRQRKNGEATLKELERCFDVTQATMAGIASRLEIKGLVIGYTDEKDRRVKHVRLSDTGRELCTKTRKSLQKSEAWLLKSLDKEEQENLHGLLLKMYESSSQNS